MDLRIALAGNPNSGKTTLFNALTGSNQFVGNWPGVTVEKKEGKLKKHDGVTVVDLPGIYSLSPYTLEEVVARNYLIDEKPDVILNIVDGSNLERNLYLTTQLMEAGLPVVIAINMMDVVRKAGDQINIDELSRQLGCKVVEISALKNEGIMEAAEAAIAAAKAGKTVPHHTYSGVVEHAIAHIEEAAVHNLPENEQRWYAVKLFERDEKARAKLNLPQETLDHIETDIVAAEKELDDDAESIITNERYVFVGEVIKACYKKKSKIKMTTSDKIDRVLTHRIWALPIFAVIMFLVYFISVTTVGGWATDWVNDGVFGDGFHLLGIGQSKYETASEDFGGADEVLSAYIDFAKEKGYNTESLEAAIDSENENFDAEAAKTAVAKFVEDVKTLDGYAEITYTVTDEETLVESEKTAYYNVTTKDAPYSLTMVNDILVEYEFVEPDPANYGVWVMGIPALATEGLEKAGCAPWLQSLLVDGIIGGVGAVLGFVPQIFVLFIFLAFLEGCGYMARIAFVLDRIFRKFGLSGKSFIPMLIASGCGVPAVMSTKTIENEMDRRMTIMTTTMIPCGAKMPIIALVFGALASGDSSATWYVAPMFYFLGVIAIILSGIMLKKTKLFAGDATPFVMELPEYHMPTVKSILLSMWERVKGYIIKAGTIIFLSTIVIWFLMNFGDAGDGFGLLDADAPDYMDYSLMAGLGNLLAWIFAPLGFDNWQAAATTITGLVAKENVVATVGIITQLSSYGESDPALWLGFGQMIGGGAAAISAFCAFNLLCAPCFAAMGTIRQQQASAKWFWITIGYLCGFAWCVGLMIHQFVGLATGEVGFSFWTIIAIAVAAALLFQIFRPMPKHKDEQTK